MDAAARRRVLETMLGLAVLPEGVDETSVLRLDEMALGTWWRELELLW